MSPFSLDSEVAKCLLMKPDTQNINKRELMQPEQRKLSGEYKNHAGIGGIGHHTTPQTIPLLSLSREAGATLEHACG